MRLKDIELFRAAPKDDNPSDPFFAKSSYHFNFPIHSHMDTWYPPLDVYETKDYFILKMEISGITRDDVEITIKDNYVVIEGNRREKEKEKEKKKYTTYHNMEIHFGHFERQIRLPQNTEIVDYNANYKDGFLIVKLKKGEKSTRVIKKIKIE